jgi:dihydroorotase
MNRTTTIGGRIASHNEKPYYGAISIDKKTGLITSVKRGKSLTADHTFPDRCLIFPGLGDVHIHAREDETGKQIYKEEYRTAADAALHGGVVHVCAMPNTPNPVTTRDTFAWHRARIASLDHTVTILNYLGIDSKTKPIGKPGDFFYKLYFGKSVGDLTVTYASELDLILARYKGQHISFHVEYEPIVQANASGATHSKRRPVECVNEGLRLLLPLIEKYKIRAKLCHWSTGGESFEMIAEYRARGCMIELEVSPLHLLFDTDMTDADPELWTKVQMNPAIQAPAHREALIRGLKTGFINYLATDHAPHTEEEKFSAFSKFRNTEHSHILKNVRVSEMTNKVIALSVREQDKELFLKTCLENNHSGAPWLDTYGVVCTWLMKTHRFTPQDIARVAAYNPGRFVNQYLKRQKLKRAYGKGFGEIKKGYMGSLTVLNVEGATEVTRDSLKTKVQWSPLEGYKMPGSVEAVFVRGVRR